jgi:hypothetical protein
MTLSVQTTAHALCFAFALLALYQEEQEKLFDHIKTVLPDGRLPVCDIPLLPLVASRLINSRLTTTCQT